MSKLIKVMLYASVFTLIAVISSGCALNFKLTSETEEEAGHKDKLEIGYYSGDADNNPNGEVYVGEKGQSVINVAGTAVPLNSDKASNKAEIASKDDSNASPDPGAANLNERPFRLDRPSLMGFTLSTPSHEVKAAYGEPQSTYEMQTGKGSVTVYEYDGFTFGFRGDRMEYVSVHSPEIDPGLNGIKVGSQADQLHSKLGKPVTDSGYVITYELGNQILQISNDPAKNAIQSILLSLQ